MKLLLLLGVLAAACSRPEVAPSKTDPPAAGTAADPLARKRARLLNIPLVTHDGRRVRFYDDLVRGKVVTINFMFATCRGECPATTANLAEVQRRLGERAGRDVTMLSITLDAGRDTPEVLRRYAETYRVGPGWYFLTGDHDDIERLRRSLGIYDLDPVVDADRTQHAGIVVIGNEPAGRWSMMPALMKPVRIVQSIERAIAPPTEWVGGPALDEGIPFEASEASAALVERVERRD